MPKRRSKARRTRQEARKAGRRSGFEMRVEEALGRRFIVVEYEPERIKFPRRDGAYIPDFRIPNAYGQRGHVYVEAKGRFLSSDRTKLKAVRAAHPGIDLRLVFQRNLPLRRGSPTRYMDWAQQHGFKASVFPELPI